MMYNYYGNRNRYYNYPPYYQSNLNNQFTEEYKKPENIIENNEVENKTENKTESVDESKKTLRLGPVSLCGDEVSVFGFSLHIDDIIIIGLAIFLFFENRKDYLLIIVLGLILFDFSFDNIKQIGFLKSLFDTH